MIRLAATVVVVSLLGVATADAQRRPRFRATNFTAPADSQINSVNSHGDLVGEVSGSGATFPYFYINRRLVTLDIPGWLDDINDRRQAVGNAFDPFTGLPRAFVRSRSGVEYLPTLGGDFVEGAAINNRGAVVGRSNVVPGGTPRAFVYEHGFAMDLGASPTGGPSRAFDINDRGTIVGCWVLDFPTGAFVRGFVYKDGLFTEIETFGGLNSCAFSINSRGEIVGMATDASENLRAFRRFADGRMEDLGTLTNSPTSSATALHVSDRGEVAGFSDGAAFLYSRGVIRDISTLTSLPAGAFVRTIALSPNSRWLGVTVESPSGLSSGLFRRRGQQ